MTASGLSLTMMVSFARFQFLIGRFSQNIMALPLNYKCKLVHEKMAIKLILKADDVTVKKIFHLFYVFAYNDKQRIIFCLLYHIFNNSTHTHVKHYNVWQCKQSAKTTFLLFCY